MKLTTADCYWYHSIELPGIGKVQGPWELSEIQSKYLAGVDFTGKKVTEIGPASGRITVELEKLGAAVTCLDVGAEFKLDSLAQVGKEYTEFLKRVNNAHSLVRDLFKLKANFINGSAYNKMPVQCQIGVLGNILLHLRDPFKAIYNLASSTSERIVIVETVWNWPLYAYLEILATLSSLPFKLRGHTIAPEMTLFMPTRGPDEQFVWWYLRPSLLERYLNLCGFEVEKLAYHTQRFNSKRSLQFTLVAKRTWEGYQMHT